MLQLTLESQDIPCANQVLTLDQQTIVNGHPAWYATNTCDVGAQIKIITAYVFADVQPPNLLVRCNSNDMFNVVSTSGDVQASATSCGSAGLVHYQLIDSSLDTSMSSYLTLDRAKQAIKNAPSQDDEILSNIIDAACNTVENYLRRKLTLQTYSELYHGTGTVSLFLEEAPVANVASVRTGRQPAIYIQNNAATGVNQAALVQVTSTSVLLTLITNAVTTTTSFLFVDYPTIIQLRDAINAIGNDWFSTVPPVFETWSSADLQFCSKGAYSARNLTVGLQVFYWYIYDFRIHQAGTDIDLAELYYAPGWLRGYDNYMVNYTAGFNPIPEELLQATAELVKVTYLVKNLNPNLHSESLGQYSYVAQTQMALKSLSPLSWQAMNHYKIPRIPRWSAY